MRIQNIQFVSGLCVCDFQLSEWDKEMILDAIEQGHMPETIACDLLLCSRDGLKWLNGIPFKNKDPRRDKVLSSFFFFIRERIEKGDLK